MNLLVIDTTSENMVIALSSNGQIFSKISQDGSKSHNRLILPFIDQLVENANITIKQIDAIGCVVGAGSFTGIRIGVATAKAISTAVGAPTIAITSFETQAYNIKDKYFAICIDAKHDNFYTGIFENSWENCVQLGSFSKQDLIDKNIKIYEKTTYSNPEVLINITQQKFEKSNFEELMPLYLKKSQA